MLEARQLRKTFSSSTAVEDVSFQVMGGTILGLLGPNGAGKTTTIRMLLNILQPDRGRILYEGQPFVKMVRSHSGYLPEERGLYRKSTVLDTLLYFAELRGMRRRDAREAAYRWLRRFQLDQRAGQRVEELSRGNQQKVQFVVAVLHNPTVIVLDEPFSGLDPVNQEMMRDILMEKRENGCAIILSTHLMDQAEQMSDHLCLINKGRVVLGGGVAEVKQNHATETVRIEFSGDGTLLRGIRGVKNVRLFSNGAEIELEDRTAADGLLARLVDRLDVRRYEVVEPSLQSIFMKAVAEGREE